MIKFSLYCENDHDFEIWFGSSEDFEKQKKRGLLSCPSCGSLNIDKALMAPSVSTGRKKDQRMQIANMQKAQSTMVEKIKEFRESVVNSSEDVGNKFPEEARKIHYGEADARSIRGEANVEEATELVKEGIDILPIPALPEDNN